MDKDQELMIVIDEVVHYLWDPIGIAWHPEARDEYKGYIPELFVRTKAGKISEILVYMEWMVIERMGLPFFNQSQALKIAEFLLQWRDVIWQSN
ncbi:hypothetical protein Syn7502_03121 [Synechococcus sp. PCC 7502]|uniref:hypothetical protein n=1 Tax=Synechococcus sp. PCC 7502 TaxID=1173263 RepID=UPI00029FCE19|nr:hypothetical protein [Synechococcus sp. PCC 7502]AFY75018.1 hypothetical protein Syn7502_03121 [Synechococcus sp. PCC 7502]